MRLSSWALRSQSRRSREGSAFPGGAWERDAPRACHARLPSLRRARYHAVRHASLYKPCRKESPVPDDPSWLDRLDCATDYRALQEIFSEITAAAHAGDDPAGLARSVDEAIRRLEAERASDERELAEI